MFENAKWIGAKVDVQNPSPLSDGSNYFQKVFTVKKSVSSASLSCVGLGYGYFYINGGAVSDEVLPTPTTKFDARVIYRTSDVTALLHEGENVLGAYVGNGWYNDIGSEWNFEKNSWRAERKMVCQLDITYTDGTRESIVSDSSFRCADGPSVYNHVREGELYDARLAIADFASVPHSDFRPVVITHPPGGILETSDLPPIRVTRTIVPKKIIDTVYDVGESVSGWAVLTCRGEAGREVHLTYAEIFENGDIVPQNINRFTYGKLRHEDRYILRGEGEESFHPCFMYHAFRYIKVEGAPEDMTLTVEVLHTDLARRGSFSTSDGMLQRIHEASLRSTLYNYHSFPTDCPHREQNGWTGDMLISVEQTLMNFEMKAAYRKLMNDLSDAQRPNGQLPGIVPTTSWGYNWGSGPAWDSLIVLLPGQYYDATGDLSLIRDYFDRMEKYMSFFSSMAEDYVADFGLGDWCPVQKEHIVPSVVTDTAFYYTDARAMARYAALLGRDATAWESLAQKIRNAWRARFLADFSLLSHQTFLSCGITLGLFDNEEIPAMAQRLNSLVVGEDYHINCGILGAKWIFRALGENGYNDTLYKMVTNPTAPSYAYWILSGLTTLAEQWDLRVTGSRFHHMYSEVEHWFYRYLGGFRFEGGDLTLAPVFIEGIESVTASVGGTALSYDRDSVTVTTDRALTLVLGEREYSLGAGTHKLSRN